MEALLATCMYPAFVTLVCVGLFRSTQSTQHHGRQHEVRKLSLNWFLLDAFPKQTETTNLFVHVHPSLRPRGTRRLPPDGFFMKIRIWDFY